MANIFQNPTHKANLSYNGFDMSRLVTFSSTTGELRPIYFDILQPGDKVRCSTVLKTRTLPLASPAMCHINEHIEWFFVPFDQLFHRFGEWFNGIKDPKSSLYTSDPIGYLPYYSPDVFQAALVDGFGSSHPDMFNYNGTYFRIMEDLGIPIVDIDKSRYEIESISWPLAISPFVAAAYQKIYFDFYRITEREALDVQAFQFDDVCGYTGGIPETMALTRLFENFKLRYRPRQKDFFNNLLVSPIFGAGEIGGNLNTDLTSMFSQWLVPSLNYSTFGSDGSQNNSNPSSIGPSVYSDLNGSYSLRPKYLTPTSIRTSFALDKLLSVTQRSAKRVDKQQLAHFGVNIKDGVGQEVVFIGRDDSSITIGDVISTSDTADGTNGAVLGDIAGKGYNLSKSKQITYEADRHGILMAIYSAEPEYDYPAFGLDKLNALINLNDFPRPEFDNLGMQPLFGYQLYLTPNLGGAASVQNSKVLGWQYRWSEFKTKYNVVTGALRYGRSLDYWKVQIHRNRTDFTGAIQTPFFYVSPNDLDDLMAVNYNFDIDSPDQERFDTDPLIHECFFNVKKSSKMSTYGLEQL